MINRLFRFTWFPLALQLITLGVFILLIAGGLAANTDDMVFAKVLRNTNVANLIVWSYWWPLIILSSIFLGRVWCTVCPMELVTSLAAKVGLKKKPPSFFRNGWVVTGFFILIIFIGVNTLAIHRVPFRMAVYMIILFFTAVASGLIFSRNTFCAHVCPVGRLLGIYARHAPIGWGVKDKDVCKSCKDRSCISLKTAYNFQGHSCNVGLRPATLDDNTDCLLCGQCLKACDRYNPGGEERPNPGIFSRKWFKDLLTLKPLTTSQAVLCLVVSGFVIDEVFSEWSFTKKLLRGPPESLAQIFGGGPFATGPINALVLFAALPLLLWLLPFAVFRIIGGRIRFGEFFLRFGIAFIPIMAAAHGIKALVKMTSRIPFWKYVPSDPIGEKTAQSIMNNKVHLSALPSWSDWIITALAITLMGISVALSVVIIRKLITKHLPNSGRRSIPLYLIPAIYGGGFLLMILAWRLF